KCKARTPPMVPQLPPGRIGCKADTEGRNTESAEIRGIGGCHCATFKTRWHTPPPWPQLLALSCSCVASRGECATAPRATGRLSPTGTSGRAQEHNPPADADRTRKSRKATPSAPCSSCVNGSVVEESCTPTPLTLPPLLLE